MICSAHRDWLQRETTGVTAESAETVPACRSIRQGSRVRALAEDSFPRIQKDLNHAVVHPCGLRFPVSQDVYDLLNRTEHTGGGPLFGIKGNVIVGHGRARASAIKGAIATAKRLSELSLTANMQEELAAIHVSTPA